MFLGWFNRKNQEKEYSNNPPENANFSFLGADMHSHFIPGIDDGSTSIEVSLNMIRSMVEMGYNTIITTPHIMIDYYPNTPQIIGDGLKLLQNAVTANNIKVSLKAAAEYYIDEYFIGKLEQGGLLKIYDNEVLVEFSMYSEPPMLKEVIFKMMTTGYRPILAHPERYNFLHNDLDRFRDFKDRGCLLQLNTLSVSGYYGPSVKKVAELLLERGLYDYCGTDIHHEKHVSAIAALLNSKAYNLLIKYPFLNKKLCF